MTWYHDSASVLAFAHVLDDIGAFSETSDVIRYFEKPWHWQGEHDRWELVPKGEKLSNYSDWIVADDPFAFIEPLASEIAGEIKDKTKKLFVGLYQLTDGDVSRLADVIGRSPRASERVALEEEVNDYFDETISRTNKGVSS